MARRGFTEKACPGCGETGIREIDHVCGSCQSLIEDGKLLRQRDEAALASSSYVWRVVPTRDGDYPFYFWRDATGDTLPHETATLCAVTSALANVVRPLVLEHAAGVRSPLRESIQPLFSRARSGGFGGSERELLPSGVPERLEALDLAIQAAITTSYAAGYRNGGRLLTRLANGSMSVEQFNELHTQVSRKQ